MAANLKTALGTTASIPIPTIPTSFFPGATPVSSLATVIYDSLMIGRPRIAYVAKLASCLTLNTSFLS